MKKILKVLSNTAFFLVVGVIIVTLFTARFPVFGTRSFIVLTGSMEPKLHVGSVVFVMPKPSYKIGDIITFNRGNITVTHRLKGMIGDMYQTKGDANKIADVELVKKSEIIGQDIAVIPYLGRFTNFLRTVPGFSLFLGFPILIYIGVEGWIIKKEWEKEIEKRVLARLNITEAV